MLSAVEAIKSVDTIDGTSEGPDLIRGSVDTEDAAAKPNRPPPTAAEMLVEWATSLEL